MRLLLCVNSPSDVLSGHSITEAYPGLSFPNVLVTHARDCCVSLSYRWFCKMTYVNRSSTFKESDKRVLEMWIDPFSTTNAHIYIGARSYWLSSSRNSNNTVRWRNTQTAKQTRQPLAHRWPRPSWGTNKIHIAYNHTPQQQRSNTHSQKLVLCRSTALTCQRYEAALVHTHTSGVRGVTSDAATKCGWGCSYTVEQQQSKWIIICLVSDTYNYIARTRCPPRRQ